jgi:hypothetical protein
MQLPVAQPHCVAEAPRPLSKLNDYARPRTCRRHGCCLFPPRISAHLASRTTIVQPTRSRVPAKEDLLDCACECLKYGCHDRSRSNCPVSSARMSPSAALDAKRMLWYIPVSLKPSTRPRRRLLAFRSSAIILYTALMRQFIVVSGDFVATTGIYRMVDHPEREITLIYGDAVPTFQGNQVKFRLIRAAKNPRRG